MKLTAVQRILPSRGQLICLTMIALLLVSFFPLVKVKADGAPWWNAYYGYRQAITINHAKVVASLTNFSVLISISDSNLASHAKSNGYDIVFTDANGNKLNHEIEFFNKASGTLVAWVKVPSLSSVSDTVLYMYYGNPSASNQQNVVGTWDANYVMVQHLEQTTGLFLDSTGHNNGTAYGGITRNVTGEIDGAASFNGASGYVTLPFELSPPYTVECWANPATLSQIGVIFTWGTTDSGNGVSMGIWNSGSTNQILVGNNAYQYGLTGVSTYLTAGTWAYWCDAVTATNNIAFYLNGAQKTLSNENNWFSNQAGYRTVGARYYSAYSRFWSGMIDEVRISNIVRSAAWISTGYNNEQSPSSFCSVGSVETFSPSSVASNPSPLNGTSGVSTSLSSLSFNLTNNQNDLMNYYVTTSPNIGSGSGLGVHNGAYCVSVSGLQLNTTYTWQVCAFDQSFGIWNNQTFNFKTMEYYGNWWNNHWPYRQAITIYHTQVSANLTNFPVFLDVTDANLANYAQTNGNDIVFTNANGNKLNHEIEFYNNSIGRLITWVEVPSLSSVTNTLLYMYYGNPVATNQQNVTGTWDSNFVVVQHLNQAIGTFKDSTGYGNNGKPYGGISRNVPGQLDGAASFDGKSGYVNLGDAASLQGLTGQVTLEAWIYLRAFNAVNQTQLVYKIGGTGYGTGFELQVNGVGNLLFRVSTSGGVYGGGAAGTVNLNTWQFVVGTFNVSDDGLRTYVNGALASTQPGPTALPSTTYNATLVGWPPSNGGEGYYGNVTMDEARISNVARTTAWISTEYNNEQSPSSFYSVGPEEIFSLKFPDVSNPSPLNGTSGVSTSLSSLSFNLADYLNDSMNYYVTTSPSIGSGSGLGAHNGAYYVSVSGFQLQTTYTWQVCAIDPLFGIWNNQTFSFKTFGALGITNTSPTSILELERRSQQTFQVSYNASADTTWYLNGLQQQINQNLQTASWQCTFNYLGTYNITAFGTYYGLTARCKWSVQVVMNFSGGVSDRTRTDFKASQSWEQGWVYDEQVWYDNDYNVYFMLYSGAPIGQRELGFAWSTNGFNWTKDAGNPVMTPLGSGTWEHNDIYWAMCRIKINGIYWMYYEGGDDAAGLMFLKIVPDGNGGYTIANLTRYSGNPVWLGTMEFCCARVNSTYWIGYVGTSTVSCVSSTDGEHWAYVKQDILRPQSSGWDSSDLYPVLTYIYDDTVYVILSSMVQDGVAYCRVGDWTNLTFSPNNPNLPIGTSGTWEGGQASGLTFKVDEDYNVIINSNNTLECWYLGCQSLGGSGDSGVGYCRIYSINGPTTDLTVTGIIVDNHGCSIYKNDTCVDGSPYYYPVEVTIRNLGSITTSSFYVKLEVYWINGSLLEASEEISVTGLTSGNSLVVNFTNLFHPMHTRYYQLTATVDSRNNITETNKANNSLVLGNIPVTVVGDVNGDGVVNILDAVLIAQAWGATPSNSNWNIKADINHGGTVDILDATRIGMYWGATW